MKIREAQEDGRRITADELAQLGRDLAPLVGLRISWLSIPTVALAGFEPSQLAVLVNTLLDAVLPQVSMLSIDDPIAQERLSSLGLSRSPQLVGQREGYPDFAHTSGKRVELKGLFVNNPSLTLKRPPTPREPSARLKENVRVDTVDAQRDALLVAAAQLQALGDHAYPVIVDLGVFSMIDCVEARDRRLLHSPGAWFERVPKVLTRASRIRLRTGHNVAPIEESGYLRDTNFGKLNRIPHPPLVQFLRKHGYAPARDRSQLIGLFLAITSNLSGSAALRGRH